MDRGVLEQEREVRRERKEHGRGSHELLTSADPPQPARRAPRSSGQGTGGGGGLRGGFGEGGGDIDVAEETGDGA